MMNSVPSDENTGLPENENVPVDEVIAAQESITRESAAGETLIAQAEPQPLPSVAAPASPTLLEALLSSLKAQQKSPANEQPALDGQGLPLSEESQPDLQAIPAPADPTLLEAMLGWLRREQNLPDNAQSALQAADASLSEEPGLGVAAPNQPAPATAASSISVNDLLNSWLIILSFGFAMIGQWCLMPEQRAHYSIFGVGLYLLSGLTIIALVTMGQWKIQALSADNPAQISRRVRWRFFWAGVLCAFIAFILYDKNLFTKTNLTFGVLAVVLLALSFWQADRALRAVVSEAWENRPNLPWQPTINWLTIAILAVALVSIFFRTWKLNSVPFDMFSDQAEKLFDVGDVLAGYTKIFFERNTGREAVQFYLTAFFAKYFNTGLSFLSLKLGTGLLGLLLLPYLYLVAKEITNWRVALLATFLCGVAYWPNVQARVGLRYMLAGFFFAPVFYHFIRGLRWGKMWDFVLCGVFLGIGMQGYSTSRVLPLLLVVLTLVYLLHQKDAHSRKQALWGLLVVTLFSLVVFSPLLRFMLTPEGSKVMERGNSRLFPADVPAWELWKIFWQNQWNVLTMFFYSNGQIWVHSIPYHPALDFVTAPFYFLGSLVVLIRYIQKRHWFDLGLLITLFIMLTPSSMSLAFPAENPSLNRTTGAILPAFLLAGIGFESWLGAVYQFLKNNLGRMIARTFVAWIAFLLCVWVASNNYTMLFQTYNNQYQRNAWNTSQMGSIVNAFLKSGGSPNNVWMMTYPYWADTRLVALTGGIGAREIVLDVNGISSTLATPGQKLFIVKMPDPNGGENDIAYQQLKVLRETYPNYVENFIESEVPGHEFITFWVLK